MLYKEAEVTVFADSLKHAVVPESFPWCHRKADYDKRVVEIVPFIHTDRYPLPGLLTWVVDGQRHKREVTIEDYHDDALAIEVP